MFLAAPAHAATVTARDEVDTDVHSGVTYHTRTVQFTAAAGEPNRVVLEPFERFRVMVRDAAGISPQAPCRAEDPQTVVCPPSGGMIIDVTLADGDDTLSSTSTVTRVDAG